MLLESLYLHFGPIVMPTLAISVSISILEHVNKDVLQ